MDRIPNTNSTISSQLFEYRIIQIIRSNSVLDNNFLIPKLNFSPESGGKVKPRTAIDAISRQGTIKLEK